mmetsp:Transcript_13738/g.20933  ORF Transcript_13738/g.20933 Transcript_13738/m.20933 type:complete len:87 (-) Transcript_13738:92-352(-)
MALCAKKCSNEKANLYFITILFKEPNEKKQSCCITPTNAANATKRNTRIFHNVGARNDIVRDLDECVSIPKYEKNKCSQRRNERRN